MKIEQRVWAKGEKWSLPNEPDIRGKAPLVVLGATTEILKEKTFKTI